MEGSTVEGSATAGEGGFSVVMARKVLSWCRSIGIWDAWDRLEFGRPSGRSSAYRPSERIAAVMAGLASGLDGIGPGNQYLRPNSAMVEMLGGRFPDQGTIHRWLDEMTDEQAAALRSHLHRMVHLHGRFWSVLRSAERLIVDIDAQGLSAEGARYEEAAIGYLGDGLGRGFQRYVASTSQTDEVLDEFVRPGNTNLMGELPDVLEGLNEVLPRCWRHRVICRIDSHGGTAANLRVLTSHGYHYISRLHSTSAQKRLRREVTIGPGETFTGTDSTGRTQQVEFWDVPAWTFKGRDGRPVTTRAILYHEADRLQSEQDRWWVLVSDLPAAEESAASLWPCYHQRGGTIEEINDQTETGFHLDTLRTSHLAGLNALHALAGLCWNVIQWATTDLTLPPPLDPQADPQQWRAASSFSLPTLLTRASYSGVLLSQRGPNEPLEAESRPHNPESKAWLAWLNEPIQLRLSLAA